MDVTARRNLNMDVNLRRLPGKNNILIEILSAAYSFYMTFILRNHDAGLIILEKHFYKKKGVNPETMLEQVLQDFPSRASENAACK